MLPLLDDCLHALQPSILRLTRSAQHRRLQRHGISRLADVEGDEPKRQNFKRYPIGYFRIDIAEVRTAEGKLIPLWTLTERPSLRSPNAQQRLTERRNESSFRICLRPCLTRSIPS